MKFIHGDDTDKALVQTLLHEMMLCKEAFNDFVFNAVQFKSNPGAKMPKIQSYNSYSQFLHHLYEFYVGCFQRDRQDLDKIVSDQLDALFDSESEKQLRNRRILVENGVLDDKANLALYQKPLAPGFGASFRRIRNHTAHALVKRVVSSRENNLNAFFKQYHFVIILMFFGAQFAWNIGDPEKLDWGSIEDFDFGGGA